jgi:hypothetical protein
MSDCRRSHSSSVEEPPSEEESEIDEVDSSLSSSGIRADFLREFLWRKGGGTRGCVKSELLSTGYA